MAMEQNQELQSLSKSTMADKFNQSSKNEPEAWYKVVLKTGAEEVAELPPHSEDELSVSHGRYLSKPTIDSTSLILSQTRMHQKF